MMDTTNSASEVVKKLSAKDDLLSILMDVESYLDESNLYVFDNWIAGVIVSGPIIKKYWIDIILKYDHKQMPDPDGALRLIPHGTKVRYQKAHEQVPVEVKTPDDYQPGTKKPRMKKIPIWLVHMRIPRRFVDAIHQDILNQYEDQVAAPEDLQNAQDHFMQGGSTR